MAINDSKFQNQSSVTIEEIAEQDEPIAIGENYTRTQVFTAFNKIIKAIIGKLQDITTKETQDIETLRREATGTCGKFVWESGTYEVGTHTQTLDLDRKYTHGYIKGCGLSVEPNMALSTSVSNVNSSGVRTICQLSPSLIHRMDAHEINNIGSGEYSNNTYVSFDIELDNKGKKSKLIVTMTVRMYAGQYADRTPYPYKAEGNDVIEYELY